MDATVANLLRTTSKAAANQVRAQDATRAVAAGIAAKRGRPPVQQAAQNQSAESSQNAAS